MGLSTNAYLVIGILCLIALALLLRSGLRKPGGGKKPASANAQSAKAQPGPAKKAAPRQNPYRAASIVAGPNACEAVKRLGEKRFLVAENEVPQLPLPTCNQPRCTCKYSHHADRREAQSEDRRGPPGLRSELHAHTGESERRRKRRGRRSSDWE